MSTTLTHYMPFSTSTLNPLVDGGHWWGVHSSKPQAMGSETTPARKVMVVADPNRESAAALQYALSHVVLENDELILLHVENPSSWRNTFSFLRRPSLTGSSTANSSEGERGGIGDVDFLEEMKQVCEVAQPKFLEDMKHVCEVAQPKIRVRLERIQMEAKDKANAILNKSKQLGIDILIIGQRRSLSNAILG